MFVSLGILALSRCFLVGCVNVETAQNIKICDVRGSLLRVLEVSGEESSRFSRIFGPPMRHRWSPLMYEFTLFLSVKVNFYNCLAVHNHTGECYTNVCNKGIIKNMIIETPNEHLTPRQSDVLEFIEASIKSNGYAPSVRDVARNFNYQSTRTAAELINALNEKGFINIAPGIARGIRVINQRQETGMPQFAVNLGRGAT